MLTVVVAGAVFAQTRRHLLAMFAVLFVPMLGSLFVAHPLELSLLAGSLYVARMRSGPTHRALLGEDSRTLLLGVTHLQDALDAGISNMMATTGSAGGAGGGTRARD
jgi:hypothetical protein